jgi:hypothetical protein
VTPDISVHTAALPPPPMGLWDESTRTVWLHRDLTSAERRSTLAHELVHAERGDVPCGDPVLDTRQELRVESEAARRLLPLPLLSDVLRWARDPREAAAELDVDPAMLAVRLADLTAAERARLRATIGRVDAA